MVDEDESTTDEDTSSRHEADPSAIRSIALSPDDAVDAYAYGRENPGEAVLRVTPPFHGRMRARIHVYRVDDTELTGAVHLSPADVIADDVVAEYPDLESRRTNTADGPDEADEPDETDRIREHHAEAVEAWRERARESILETATIEIDDCSHRVELKTLG